MTFDLETEFKGTGQIGGKFVTYLQLTNGTRINGYYTAMWIDENHQVCEHHGAMLTVQGYHKGGALQLHTMPPPPRTP